MRYIADVKAKKIAEAMQVTKTLQKLHIEV